MEPNIKDILIFKDDQIKRDIPENQTNEGSFILCKNLPVPGFQIGNYSFNSVIIFAGLISILQYYIMKRNNCTSSTYK